jgi:hypothetical protein
MSNLARWKRHHGERRQNIPERVTGLHWVDIVTIEHGRHCAACDDVHSLEQVALLDNYITPAVLAHHAHAGEDLLVHGIQEILAAWGGSFGRRKGCGDMGLGGRLRDTFEKGLQDATELL